MGLSAGTPTLRAPFVASASPPTNPSKPRLILYQLTVQGVQIVGVPPTLRAPFVASASPPTTPSKPRLTYISWRFKECRSSASRRRYARRS